MVSPFCICRKNVCATARRTRKPSTYQTAPPGAPRAPDRRSPERRFLAGVLGVSGIPSYKRILFCLLEGEFSGRAVDDDAVPLAELPLQHAHRERVEDAALDGPLQRPGPVGRVVALFDDQV